MLPIGDRASHCRLSCCTGSDGPVRAAVATARSDGSRLASATKLPGEPHQKESPEMKKILVAYNGTDPADHALTTAIDLAKAFDAAVGVVSVVPIRAGRAPMAPWDDRPVPPQQPRQAQQILAGAGIEAQLHEPIGDPSRAIERTAEEGD